MDAYVIFQGSQQSQYVFTYHFSLLKNEFQKPKKLKESHKIPLYPPFSKGEANISSLWRFSPAGGRQRETGRDFQSAKVLRADEIEKDAREKKDEGSLSG
jgi:hypothetical protein